MPYVQLGDVNTWYAEEGEGEPLVLFHPGGADSRAFEMSNLAGLAERYHTYRFDRRGHGRTADVPGPIGYQQMADDSIAFIETVVGGPAYILGPQRRRAGGPAGRPHPPGSGPPPGLLLRGVQPRGLAARRPGPGRRTAEFLGGLYAEVSPDGKEHWDEVLPSCTGCTSGPTLTPDDLAPIATPALLMFADDDEVAPVHIHTMHRAMPDAQLAIVPGTGHGLLGDKPDLCNRMIIDFLDEPAPDEPAER